MLKSEKLLIYLYTAILVGCLMLISCSSVEKKITAKSNPNGRNDAWGFMGYGGGGAMFNPAVSPFNPDYAFVACDMTGSFVTYNGGKSWRMFNLHAPVHFFVFDPIDTNTVYANSIALFKSTDRGNTWKVIYPASDDIVKLVPRGDHAEEVILTRDSTLREVLAMTVDPDFSERLYAVISTNHKAAFYSSTDGGIKWNMQKELEGEVQNIFVVPSSPKEDRTIYLTCTNSVLVREKAVWTSNKGPEGILKLTSYTGGYDAASKKFILYAMSGLSYFNPKGDKSGIFYTEDGGKTWENRQDGLLHFSCKGSETPEWRAIATSAQHPSVVYVSYDKLKISADTTCIGVAKSEDFGRTWVLSWKDNFTKKGQTPSGNFKSGWINERFGPTWGENPFAIGVSPQNSEICYATDFGRTIRTNDGGKTWEQAYSNKKEGGGWISRGLEVTTGYAVVFDPFDTNHVFICNTDVGLMESRDGGESWMSATKDNGIPSQWSNSTYWLTFDPDVKGKAWAVISDVHDLPRPKMWRHKGVAGFTGGMVMTDDAGKSWRDISSSAVEAAFTHILVDPSSNRNSRTVYACAFGKGVFKSTDGGITWSMKNKGIEGKEPFAWRIEQRAKDGVLFLICSRRSDDGSIGNEQDGALYRSDDKAESWTKISLPEGSNGPTCILTDPEQTGNLLLAAWGRLMPGKFSNDEGGGIFRSTDSGKTWIPVLQKDQHIHDITYDPRVKTFYACGFTGSAYRSTDNGQTWQRIKGYNFKWGKRVDLDPKTPDMIYIVTFGGGVWHGPAKGDPNAVEDILTPVFNYE
jgi:photosystem II stability/assembly factor-like uncharacterized protein